jgi:hypothetical protein
VTDYDWWSGEGTKKLDLIPGQYNRIDPCRWVADRDGQGMVDGYVHLFYTLKPGFTEGVVRRQLVREKFGSEPDDQTWYKDETISGLVSDWVWWLAPWTGAIEKGRGYRLEIKPRAGVASMYVTSRYMKAYYLNGLAT